MTANLYFPGEELIDQALAEFMGYFWCRYVGGQVVGERIVRFLMSPEEFEAARQRFGPASVAPAQGDEHVEQLAFKALPAYHSSRDAMALVEEKLYRLSLWDIYLRQLKGVLGLHNPTLTAQEHWAMVTADARARSKAAFLVIDGQKPKQQQMLLG